MAQDTEQVIEIPGKSHGMHSLAYLNVPSCMAFTSDSKKRKTIRSTALSMEK